MPILVLLLFVAAYVVYRRSGRPGARSFHQVAAVIGWVFVALCALLAAVLVAFAFTRGFTRRQGCLPCRRRRRGLAWQMRQRAEERSPERVARIDRVAFVGAYIVYAGAAVIWLVLGLVPALAAAFPAFADQLDEWGDADTLFGEWAARSAGAALNSSSGVQVTLDYAFSALNIALATFLVVKVRGNRTANLLAIGMVGTAVAFNLQSHAALVIFGTQLGGFTQVWHDLGVHVLAGVAYVFALLLFPDGSIDRSRGRTCWVWRCSSGCSRSWRSRITRVPSCCCSECWCRPRRCSRTPGGSARPRARSSASCTGCWGSPWASPSPVRLPCSSSRRR